MFVLLGKGLHSFLNCIISKFQAPGYASLLFDSIRETDKGEYICIATNAEGQKRQSVSIDGKFRMIENAI